MLHADGNNSVELYKLQVSCIIVNGWVFFHVSPDPPQKLLETVNWPEEVLKSDQFHNQLL